MQCPDCNGNMKTVAFQGVAMYECASCRGKWLDGDELRLAQESNKSELRWLHFDPYVKHIEPGSASRKSTDCPRCLKAMTPLAYMDSGVVLQKCADCKGISMTADGFLEIVRQSSKWVTKKIPRHAIIIASMVFMVVVILFMALALSITRHSTDSDAGSVPDSLLQQNTDSMARELKDMKWKNDMAKDMMRLQNKQLQSSTDRRFK